MPTVTVRLRSRGSGGLSAPVTVGYELAAGGISHGRQLTRTNVGPTGLLKPSGPITTTRHGQMFRDLDIAGYVDVRHNVTLINCRIVGAAGAGNSAYTIRHQRNVAAFLTLRNCAIITRTATTKGIVSWGAGFTIAEDCLVLGGTDNVYLKPSQPNPSGGHAHTFRRCWFGDVQRYSGSHSDCIQIDGGDGGVLIDRCSINSFSLPAGTDPLTAQAAVTSRASGGIILTYPSTNPELIRSVHVLDSYLDGGNYTVDTAPPDGPTPTDVRLVGNVFGLHHTYGPTRTAAGHIKTGNTWADSGTTTIGRAVTAGSPVP